MKYLGVFSVPALSWLPRLGCDLECIPTAGFPVGVTIIEFLFLNITNLIITYALDVDGSLYIGSVLRTLSCSCSVERRHHSLSPCFVPLVERRISTPIILKNMFFTIVSCLEHRDIVWIFGLR